MTHPPIPQTDPRAGYLEHAGRDRRRDRPRAGRRAIHSRRRGRGVRGGVRRLARDRRTRSASAAAPTRSSWRCAPAASARAIWSLPSRIPRSRPSRRSSGPARCRCWSISSRAGSRWTPPRSNGRCDATAAGPPGRGPAGASLRRAGRYGADRCGSRGGAGCGSSRIARRATARSIAAGRPAASAISAASAFIRQRTSARSATPA